MRTGVKTSVTFYCLSRVVRSGLHDGEWHWLAFWELARSGPEGARAVMTPTGSDVIAACCHMQHCLCKIYGFFNYRVHQWARVSHVMAHCNGVASGEHHCGMEVVQQRPIWGHCEQQGHAFPQRALASGRGIPV